MDISEFSRLNNKADYQRHPWETSRKNVLFTFLQQSNISFPVDRVVDIGSGDAYVIHTLLEKNLAKEYYAIDVAYTPELINQLRKNNSDSAVVYLQNLVEYFNCVSDNTTTLFLCMDVLEHVLDERIILENLLDSNNNNYYFFAVPAYQFLFSNHDVLLGHYRRYNVQQLENILLKNDFKVIDKGYYFFSLFFFRMIDNWFHKEKKESIDNWEAGKFKTSLINGMLSIDFKLCLLIKKTGLTLPGLSCYCLCKK